MNILLTGASGFLGGHLAARLQADGHAVFGLLRDGSPAPAGALARRCTWVTQADFLAAPAAALPGLDAVLFLAGCYGRNNETLEQISAANLGFPLALLQRAVGSGVRLFLNTDTALPRDFNPYSLSKAQFADWGRMCATQSGVGFANLRLDHLYGPGDDPRKFSDFIIESCIANVPSLALTAGEQQRDFIYIGDAVDAICTVLAALADGRLQGYHELPVGSGTATRIRDFVTLVKELTGATTELRFGAVPYRPREVMLSRADTGALEALGWRLRTPLEQGLTTTIRSKTS